MMKRVMKVMTVYKPVLLVSSLSDCCLVSTVILVNVAFNYSREGKTSISLVDLYYNMENRLSGFGKKLPRAEITYFSQIVLIFFIVLTSVVNLSLGTTHQELWLTLLSSAVGVLLPAPIFPFHEEEEEQ